MLRYFYYLLIVIGLLGCDHQPPNSDFIEQLNKPTALNLQPKDSSQQLFIVSQFTGRNHRSPFELPDAIRKQPSKGNANDDLDISCQPAVQRRKTHILEQFSLQDLQLRGMIGSQGKQFGLIEIPQGQILTFQQGDYLGLNNGKVVEITSQYILIKETLLTASGCEQQRAIKLVFGQQEKN